MRNVYFFLSRTKISEITLLPRKKCPYSEFFRSIFSCIWKEYGEILRISPYSVRMWENTNQKNCGPPLSSISQNIFSSFFYYSSFSVSIWWESEIWENLCLFTWYPIIKSLPYKMLLCWEVHRLTTEDPSEQWTVW